MNHQIMNQKITQILKDKWDQNKLANFYIVEPNSINNATELNEWLCKTLSYFSRPKSIENSPDFLFISPKDKKYKISEFDQLGQFLSFSQVELKQKFVIINDAHSLSELILNKLLKTLEEPPVKCTVFLLNPYKTQLISTVYSRAILLRPHFTVQDEKLDLSKFVEGSFQDFIQYLDEHKLDEKLVLKNICDLMCNSCSDPKLYDTVHNSLLKLDRDILYNNSKLSIQQHIHSLIKEVLTGNSLKA